MHRQIGHVLSNYGIEGVHYKKEDGFYVTNEQAVKDSLGPGAFGKLFMKYDPYMYAFAPGMPKDVFERQQKNNRCQVESQHYPERNCRIAIGNEYIRLGADLPRNQ